MESQKKAANILVILMGLCLSLTIADYIHEGCEIQRINDKSKLRETSDDSLPLIIAKNGNSLLEVEIEDENYEIHLPDTFPDGLTPVLLRLSGILTLEFNNKLSHKPILTVDDVGNTTGTEKTIWGTDIMATDNCIQEMPFVRLLNNKPQFVFPVSLDEAQEFLFISTWSSNSMTVEFGRPKLKLCWNETHHQLMLHTDTSRECPYLPMVSAQQFSFTLDSVSQNVQFNDQEVTNVTYESEKTQVTFEAKIERGEVYVVQCINGCPKEGACEDLPDERKKDDDQTDVLLKSVIGILAVCVVISIIVNIMMYKQSRQNRQANPNVGNESDIYEEGDQASDMRGPPPSLPTTQPPLRTTEEKESHYDYCVETISDHYEPMEAVRPQN